MCFGEIYETPGDQYDDWRPDLVSHRYATPAMATQGREAIRIPARFNFENDNFSMILKGGSKSSEQSALPVSFLLRIFGQVTFDLYFFFFLRRLLRALFFPPRPF